MLVRIFTLQNGLQLIDNVIAIRIKSPNTNLLILKDYVSQLGNIDGTVEIETDIDTISLNDIKGSFINDNNIFSLIIDEGYNDRLFFWF